MNENDILSFVRNPTYFSPKSVHDRLYFDFSKRSYQSRLAESFSCSSINKASPKVLDTRIEDTLMQKQMATKLKLNKLKAKYQAEEMKEVRKVPQINEMSRLIATQNEGKISDVKTKYIASILNNSRFVKMAKNGEKKGVKTAHIRLDDSDGNEGVVKRKAQEEYNERNEYLKTLRQAVCNRAQVLQHQEPPNLLEMGVVDRNQYWTIQRLQKIEKTREKVTEQILKGCTFNPVLTPRLRLSSKTPRSISVSTSYSQLYQNKKVALQSSNKFKPNLHPSQRSFSPAGKMNFEANYELDSQIQAKYLKH